MHLQRHKTDKADAKMIYEYGSIIVAKKIVLWRPQSTRIQELQQCDSLSPRLNKELTSITNTHEALAQLSVVNAEVTRIVSGTIKQLKEALRQLDKQMQALIKRALLRELQTPYEHPWCWIKNVGYAHLSN